MFQLFPYLKLPNEQLPSGGFDKDFNGNCTAPPSSFVHIAEEPSADLGFAVDFVFSYRPAG